MRDGVSIRWHASIRAQEFVTVRPELHILVGAHRLPLQRRVGLIRVALRHSFPRGAQQKGVLRRHQVLVVHALQPDGIPLRNNLHSPDGAVGIFAFLLRHGFPVVCSPQVPARVREQADRVGVREELHARPMLLPNSHSQIRTKFLT